MCSKEVCWFWWTHSPLHLKKIWRAGRARQRSLMGLLLTMYASSGSCRKWGSVPDIAERPSRDPATKIQDLYVSSRRKVTVSFNTKKKRLTGQIRSTESYLSASSYNQTYQLGLPDSKLTHFFNWPVNHFQKRSQVGWHFQTSTIWAGDTDKKWKLPYSNWRWMQMISEPWTVASRTQYKHGQLLWALWLHIKSDIICRYLLCSKKQWTVNGDNILRQSITLANTKAVPKGG